MESVIAVIFAVIMLLFFVITILRISNYFLKSDKSDQAPKKNTKQKITLENRLESLRELAGGFGPDSRFHRVNPAVLKLPDHVERRAVVYESVDDDPMFVVLPTSYVIKRSDEDASPMLKMVAVLDAEKPDRSKVIFKFTVAPNLLPYHLIYIESAVKNYMKSPLNPGKHNGVPNICFPTAVSDTPEVIWENSFTSLDSFTTEERDLIIWVQAKSIREAAAAARLLQPDPTHQGLHGKVRFPLDEKQILQSAILVNLDNTVGRAVDIEYNESNDSVSFLNGTESPVEIRHLIKLKANTTEVQTENIDPPAIIKPGGDWSTEIQYETKKSRVLADYQVNVPQGKELTELRVDVGEVELLLAVDTDIQPDETFQLGANKTENSLSAIRVKVYWQIQAADTVILTPNEGSSESFIRKSIPFIVPLDRYLEPEKRIIQYDIIFEFNEGTQIAAHSLKHNYSNTWLTIRRQTLVDLLSSE